MYVELLMGAAFEMTNLLLSQIPNKSHFILNGMVTASTIESIRMMLPESKLLFIPQKIFNIRLNVLKAYEYITAGTIHRPVYSYF